MDEKEKPDKNVKKSEKGDEDGIKVKDGKDKDKDKQVSSNPNGAYASKCLSQICSMWKSNEFCDLTLKAGGKKFNVHKLLLMASSPYFKAMFANEDLIEHLKKEVELFEVDPDALSSILEFIYTGDLKMTETNVVNILQCADFFLMPDVVALCAKFLTDKMDVPTCLRNYEIGVQYRLPELVEESKSCFMRRLSNIRKTEAFLQLRVEKIGKLLETHRVYKDGAAIYNAIMDWVHYDTENRKGSLPELLSFVPKANISFDFYLSHMKDNALLQEDRKCMVWLLDYVTENRKRVEEDKFLCLKSYVEQDGSSFDYAIPAMLQRDAGSFLYRSMQRMRMDHPRNERLCVSCRKREEMGGGMSRMFR